MMLIRFICNFPKGTVAHRIQKMKKNIIHLYVIHETYIKILIQGFLKINKKRICFFFIQNSPAENKVRVENVITNEREKNKKKTHKRQKKRKSDGGYIHPPHRKYFF